MTQEKAAFIWHLDAVSWTVQMGWETEERIIAIVMSMDDIAEKGDGIQDAMGNAITLAKVLVDMRRDGATLDEMDAMLAAIAADGGL